MRIAYIKKTALASEPHTLIDEINQLEAEVQRVKGSVEWLSRQTKTIPQSLKQVLGTIEALALADANARSPSAKAKMDALERRADLEEALERYRGDLVAQQGDLETLQKALDEKKAKLSQYVAIQVSE